MKTYKNLSGKSGVAFYNTGKNFIEIKFKGSTQVYVYTAAKCGKNHIARMKQLAQKGSGLSTYISQHPQVRDNYNLKH